MTVQIIGAAAKSDDSGLILDVLESWNGLHYGQSNSATTIQSEFRSAAQSSAAVIAAPLFTAASGVPGSIGYDATVGRIVHSMASAAAFQGIGSATSNGYGFPFTLRFSLAGSIPVGLLPPLRQYRVDYVARVTVAGASEAVCGVGCDNPGLFGSNNSAAMWGSSPAVNGGRWTPRYRLLTAGAILSGTDSGISSVGWHQLSIRFTEGPVPLLEWLLDDHTVFSLAGDGAIPQPIAGSFSEYLSKGTAAGVGTTVQFAPTRYRVREIGA